MTRADGCRSCIWPGGHRTKLEVEDPGLQLHAFGPTEGKTMTMLKRSCSCVSPAISWASQMPECWRGRHRANPS
jgi:hypothetical protein